MLFIFYMIYIIYIIFKIKWFLPSHDINCSVAGTLATWLIPMGCNIWAPHRSSCCWCLLGFRLVGSVPWSPIPRRRRTEFTFCSRAFWGALDWPVWQLSNTHRCCCWRCSLRICRGTQVFLPDVYTATGRTYRHTVHTWLFWRILAPW